MQMPLHRVRPAGQRQVPAAQTVPPAHRIPQLPQFSGSDLGSTQAPLHEVSPSEQLETHRPTVHTLAGGQAVPQAPQFFGSVRTFTHALPQRLSPLRHPQFPLAQISPPPHERPHAPQFLTSDPMSTHELAQAISPGVQVAAQRALEQTLPTAQDVPHPPQWRLSFSGSTHWPPHRI